MKATKEEANYRKGTGAEHCGICTMFRPPHGCTAVAGIIKQHMTSDYFKLSTKRMEAKHGDKPI